MPRASCCSVTRLNSTREDLPLQPLSSCSTSADCQLAIRSDNGVPFAPQCPVQSLQALRLVASARHRDRAHQAGPSAAERPPRAHAPHPQTGNHTSAGFNSLQQQARFDAFVREFNTERPHRGARHEVPGRTLSSPRGGYGGLPESTIRSTIATSSSPPADASACIARKSTSQPSSPASSSASRKSTRAFGSSASCTMISDTSIWSRRPCNPSTTRSARGCHLSLRYDPLPMSPGWTP